MALIHSKYFLDMVVRWNVADPTRRVLVPKQTGAFPPDPPSLKGTLSVHERQRFVERVFLWGIQSAQRRAGINKSSPEFVVRARMNLRQRSTKMLGWELEMKNGRTASIEYEPLTEKIWKPGETTKPQKKGRRQKNDESAPIEKPNGPQPRMPFYE